jgi:hypothetical protein
VCEALIFLQHGGEQVVTWVVSSQQVQKNATQNPVRATWVFVLVVLLVHAEGLKPALSLHGGR